MRFELVKKKQKKNAQFLRGPHCKIQTPIWWKFINQIPDIKKVLKSGYNGKEWRFDTACKKGCYDCRSGFCARVSTNCVFLELEKSTNKSRISNHSLINDNRAYIFVVAAKGKAVNARTDSRGCYVEGGKWRSQVTI